MCNNLFLQTLDVVESKKETKASSSHLIGQESIQSTADVSGDSLRPKVVEFSSLFRKSHSFEKTNVATNSSCASLVSNRHFLSFDMS